jgi:putative tricarboxylic transport membrane protein
MIVFFSVRGTYSVRFLAFDVWVMTVFGVIGYFMRKFGFPVAPMVLAAVVTQMMETSLGQSMLMSQGSILILFILCAGVGPGSMCRLTPSIRYSPPVDLI